MNQQSKTLPRAHVTMLLAHRAMVRDLDRIARTADHLSRSTDLARGAALKGYTERIFVIMEHHHRGEDTLLWPKLREAGADEEALALMTGEHEGLFKAVHAWHKAIEAFTPDATGAAELVQSTSDLRELLGKHTADEERELADRLAPMLTEQLWKRFERGMVTSAPMWTLRFMPPWLASVAQPSEQAGVPAAPMVRMFRGWLEKTQRTAFGEHY